MKANTERNNNRFISELRNHWEGEGISLILGSGVSKSAGLPLWNEFIARLLVEKFRNSIKRKHNPFENYLYAIAEKYISNRGEPLEVIAGRVCPKMSSRKLRELIKTCIYKDMKEDDFSNAAKTNDLFRAIRGLCVPPRRTPQGTENHVKAVATYNYDTLLEESLKDAGIRHTIITGEKTGWNGIDDLPVYHVHGAVPFRNNEAFFHPVVTESDYLDLWSTQYGWNNLVQLICFSASPCLFIGTSFADANVRRLLWALEKTPLGNKNYAIMPSGRYPKMTSSDLEWVRQRAESMRWVPGSGTKGPNEERQVNEMMDFIYREDDKLNMKTLKKLNLNVIFVDDFNDIPGILQSIRG